LGEGLSRRTFVAGAGLLPLALALGPDLLTRAWAAAAAESFRFFDAHQAAVVREATARLIPGPTDDPSEVGHPGAREAGVVGYIDTLLAAFSGSFATPPIHTGGPFSNRPDPGRPDDMATFVPLTRVQQHGWSQRVTQLQRTYRDGVKLLDRLAGGDFAGAPAPAQDAVLMQREAADFRDVLFTHAIEGTYSVPEYGGNLGLVGWQEIHFTGDVQPVGWSDDKVATSDGPDPAVVGGVVQSVINLLGATGGG
jgi:hypothetical protein